MSDYVSPFQNPRTNSFFGPRIRNGKQEFHPGMDAISSDPAGPLKAMASGTVVGQIVYKSGNLGLLILNDDGLLIGYFGLNKNDSKKIGSHVYAGEQIGLQGNTDEKHWHTHFEVLSPAGVERLGFQQIGTNDDRTPIWTLNGNPVGPSNPVTHDMWVNLTRPRNVHNKDVLLPPETVFPEWSVDDSSQHRRPNYEGWPVQTWNAIQGYQSARGTNPNLPRLSPPFGSSPAPSAPSFGPPSGVRPGAGAIPDTGWPINPHVTDQRGPFGTGGGLKPPAGNWLYPFNSFVQSPDYPGAPPPPALNRWLGPDLGVTMQSFPDSLRDPSVGSGYYSDDRFVPHPRSRYPVDNPFTRSKPAMAAGPLSSFDPTQWLTPEQRSITGIDGPSARPSAFDDLSLHPALPGGATTSPQLYPSSPFDTTSYDWRTGRWASPRVAARSLRGDSSQLPLAPAPTAQPSAFDAVLPTPAAPYGPQSTFNPGSGAPSLDARPFPGNGILGGFGPASSASGKGILSGLIPDDAWPTPANGVLGALSPPSVGNSGSGGPETGGPSWWAQMLHEMLLRRLQGDASLDESNR